MTEHQKGLPSWATTALVGFAAVSVVAIILALAEQNQILKAELEALRETATSKAEGGPRIGVSLPEMSLTNLIDGEAVPLQTLLGDGGVIAFFTTTCPYCKQTLPVWTDLASHLQEGGFRFIGASLHPAKETATYRQEMRLPWSVWVLESGASRLGISGVPTTIAYSDNGEILGVWRGALAADQVPDIVDVVANSANSSGGAEF